MLEMTVGIYVVWFSCELTPPSCPMVVYHVLAAYFILFDAHI